MNSKSRIVTSAADGCGKPQSIRPTDNLPSRDQKGAEYKESFMLSNRSSISRGCSLVATAFAAAGLLSAGVAGAATVALNGSSGWQEYYNPTATVNISQQNSTPISYSGNAVVAGIQTASQGGNSTAGYYAYTSGAGAYAAPYTTAALLTTGVTFTSLVGQTLSATFSINNSTLSSGANFTSNELVGVANPTGPTDPQIRLWFQGSGAYNMWWSDSAVAYVTSMSNGQSVTISESITGLWSNLNGHSNSADPTDFNTAIAAPISVGLSLGTGNFYMDGFGFKTGGTANLTLTSFTGTTATPIPGSGLLAAVGSLALIGGMVLRRRMAPKL